MFGVLDGDRAIIVHEKTNKKVRNIGRTGALAVQSNDSYTAILYSNGAVRSYNNHTGSDLGKIGRDKAVNIDLHEGRIVITYEDGRWRRYNVRRRIQASKQSSSENVGDRIYRKTNEKIEAMFDD